MLKHDLFFYLYTIFVLKIYINVNIIRWCYGKVEGKGEHQFSELNHFINMTSLVNLYFTYICLL